MRINLMIEGQEGVTWEQWMALAQACEENGIDTLFRSDHYGSTGAGSTSSLDAWTTLAGLAAATSSLRLGTLVSPVTFRHPSVLAKSVVTVDHISGGRVELGIGAGWMDKEHASHGFEFPVVHARMDMLAEQLEIIHRQWTEESFDFNGEHYRLADSRALPKPVQQPHPPLIIGGDAGPQSAALAAEWADEYNTVFATPDECRAKRSRLERAFDAEGRDPTELRFSLMTTCIVGVDRAEVTNRARRVLAATGRDDDPEAYLDRQGPAGVLGTVHEAVAKLRDLEAAGVDRVMLQHLDHSDLEMVTLLGREIAPALA